MKQEQNKIIKLLNELDKVYTKLDKLSLENKILKKELKKYKNKQI